MYYDYTEPNKEKFEEVCEQLKSGVPLNLYMIHDIFGKMFFGLILLTLCDSRQDIINLVMKNKDND